jgi:hypothetical protein
MSALPLVVRLEANERFDHRTSSRHHHRARGFRKAMAGGSRLHGAAAALSAPYAAPSGDQKSRRRQGRSRLECRGSPPESGGLQCRRGMFGVAHCHRRSRGAGSAHAQLSNGLDPVATRIVDPFAITTHVQPQTPWRLGPASPGGEGRLIVGEGVSAPRLATEKARREVGPHPVVQRPQHV